MGPVIVMGAAYVQIEAWTWETFLAALPVALLVAAILHANNLRDIENDRKQGKVTIAAILGRPAADYELAALILGAYAIAIALAVTNAAPLWTLVALASLPLAARLLATLRLSREARALNVVLAGTAGLHMVFGLLWALGYALEAWTS
jgi:1,4-dihydroxy-2-naphthoate octaprenyltransferase